MAINWIVNCWSKENYHWTVPILAFLNNISQLIFFGKEHTMLNLSYWVKMLPTYSRNLIDLWNTRLQKFRARLWATSSASMAVSCIILEPSPMFSSTVRSNMSVGNTGGLSLISWSVISTYKERKKQCMNVAYGCKIHLTSTPRGPSTRPSKRENTPEKAVKYLWENITSK